MKKHLIIFFSLLLTLCAIGQKADKIPAHQSNSYIELKKFKADTLGYVQKNFIDNKSKYIGKDISVLLHDIEIPIISYMPGISFNNDDIMPDITLQFYSMEKTTQLANSPNKPTDIIIELLKPVPMDSATQLFGKSQGKWTDAERKYYGKQKIGDILTTNWNL